MKILAILAVVAGVNGAQTPTVDEVMAKVGANLAQAEAQRRDFVYTQKQTLRLVRGNGKVAREEHREYVMTPRKKKTDKKLVHFDGKYDLKGKLIGYDEPGYHYKGVDVDGDLINSLSDDLMNDKEARDGIGQDLFPLAAKEQAHYLYKLAGTETYRGRKVYRVRFEPKKGEHHLEGDGGKWKGDALIDAEEFQPVTVQTSLAYKIPAAVKILLGTNISGLGYAVSYEKFEDGIWFPVSYGGEFSVRGLFFYKRAMSVALVNRDFHKLDVNSKIDYVGDGNL